jgi:hypothetical protein
MAVTDTTEAVSVLGAMIRELNDDDPSLTSHELADQLILILEDENSPAETARPALIYYIANLRRGQVRRKEQSIRHGWNPSQHGEERRAAGREIYAERLAEYANEYVDIPGAGRVRVGLVTVPQWRERISMMQEGIARDMKSVAFDEEVVTNLEKKGVDNIDTYLS